MVKANMPWSLKGVSPKARQTARTAAKQAGVPVGVWLTQVIREVSAAEQGRRGKGSASGSTTRHDAPAETRSA
jgi:localization factor PodJL